MNGQLIPILEEAEWTLRPTDEEKICNHCWESNLVSQPVNVLPLSFSLCVDTMFHSATITTSVEMIQSTNYEKIL
jgi:hypothetical protein